MSIPRPSSSLKTLIRLSALKPVAWLSEDDAASSPLIRWIALDVAAAREGDALFVPGPEVDEALIREAAAKKLVALIVHGQLAEETPSPALPVAVLPAQADPEATYRLFLTLLIDQRAQLMEWGSGIHTELDRMVADGAGLEDLARTMMEISGRSVIIQDKRLNVVAYSQQGMLADAQWQELLTELGELEKLPEPLRDRKRAGKNQLTITQSLSDNIERIVTGINVGGVARGYLSLLGLHGDLDDLDHVVADQGAVVCAVQMSRSKAVRETEKRLHVDLLTAVLKDDVPPRDARLWAQTMGLDLDHAHVALRFAWDTVSPPSRRRLETLVNGEITRKGLTAIVSRIGNEVICFCQVPAEVFPPVEAIDLGHRILVRARQEDARSPARCGIGTPAGELNHWRISFRQAGQALEMARRLSENRPMYFPDLSVYRLLMQIEHTPELLDFHREILGELLKYETGDELIRTLNVYFEHNGNLSQAAEALFIHRNSLLYRMERIAELTSLNINNPETRLAMQLALHIHKMFRGLK